MGTPKGATNLTVANANGATAENSTNPKVAEEQKPELSNLAVTAPGKPEVVQEPKGKDEIPPIQTRLKKLDELNQLTERRSLLVDALDDVNSFVLTSTGSPSIKFNDGAGHSFSVSHHVVISEMVELAKARLISEIDKIDAQIIF